MRNVAALDAYEEALADDNASAAKALVNQLLAGGADAVDVLTDVIATAQRKVGVKWQRGEWTVADEHAATAISVAATEAVSRHVRRTPATRGRLLVACAEREWHALPAMMIDCALRANGWDSILMGAATSPRRLNRYLQDYGPEAVAVSCSVLGALPASRRFIEASRAAGVPIVVGGPAFGYDDVRAKALGATAWAADAQGAVSAVEGLPAVVPPAASLPSAPAAEQGELELDHRRLVSVMRQSWSLTAKTSDTESQARAREVADDVLNQLLHAVSATLLTTDVRPVPETALWIADLLRTRGADPSLVCELAEVAAAALRGYPLAKEIVDRHFTDALGSAATGG